MVITPTGVIGHRVMKNGTPNERGHARDISTEESVMANLKKSESVVRHMTPLAMVHVDKGQGKLVARWLMFYALNSRLDLSPGVVWVPANLMLGVPLRWTSILSREDRVEILLVA